MNLDIVNFYDMMMENLLTCDDRSITHSDFHDVSQNDIVEEEKQNDIVEEENIEPQVGMEFESLSKAMEFYTLFAKVKGFGIRIRSRKENNCILVCVREGKLPIKK